MAEPKKEKGGSAAGGRKTLIPERGGGGKEKPRNPLSLQRKSLNGGEEETDGRFDGRRTQNTGMNRKKGNRFLVEG